MSFLQALKEMSTRLFSGRNTAPPFRSQKIHKAAITVASLDLCLFTALFCRTPGPEHLQVTHGDVSVLEGGAAADDLAGLPAGGGGELPEQGTATALAPYAANGRRLLFLNPSSVLSAPSPGKSCGSCALSK